jgi:hypothetical protein
MRERRRRAPVVTLSLLALLCGACVHAVPAIPARGAIGGQALETTVDSPAARYYLESYLRGERRAPDGPAVALAPGAPTLVALGRDHYLAEDPELGLKTLALTRAVLALLERTPRPACGAPLS